MSSPDLVLIVADRYQMPKLVQLCESRIAATLSLANGKEKNREKQHTNIQHSSFETKSLCCRRGDCRVLGISLFFLFFLCSVFRSPRLSSEGSKLDFVSLRQTSLLRVGQRSGNSVHVRTSIAFPRCLFLFSQYLFARRSRPPAPFPLCSHVDTDYADSTRHDSLYLPLSSACFARFLYFRKLSVDKHDVLNSTCQVRK